MLLTRPIRLTLAALAFFLVTACSPPDPIYIAYLGGLSGRVNDLGLGGRNGVQLAVELRNKQGGIKGRKIVLIEADDQQDPEIARRAVKYLIERKVEAIIGPMTSSMAVAALPLINQAQLIMISPTVTTNELSGLDDYFFRVIPATSEFTTTNIRYAFHTQGLRRIRMIYDLSNRSYTESWVKDFSAGFSKAGGKLLSPIGFTSSDDVDFRMLARQALAEKPDAVYLLANSVDAAMLCKHIRALNKSIMIGTSEWAATERLIDLGGESVDGIIVAQFFDRQNNAPSYTAFVNAYTKRFHQPPGFAGMLAFDATHVLLDAIEHKKADQSLKQALLAQKAYTGLQSPITFDTFGDIKGKTFIAKIKDGTFLPVPTH